MSHLAITVLALTVGLVYIIGLLGMMAWMAHNAAKTSPAAISHIAAQPDILNTVTQFTQKNRYRLQTHTSDPIEYRAFRKGRGWLTSLTEFRLYMHSDGSARMEVVEAVNFLFKMIEFPINAPTFLGLPIRKRKLKAINVLLNDLKAPTINFKSGVQKKIRLKK